MARSIKKMIRYNKIRYNKFLLNKIRYNKFLLNKIRYNKFLFNKIRLNNDFWEILEYSHRESQNMWWLTEIVADGKKVTQLEDALKKGRSFKKEELLAPNKWLTPKNYRTYVRRVVEIIQKFKDVNKTLDGDTDKTLEELKAEYELIKNHLTSRKGRRKPHTVFALHKKELKVKRGDAWSELKEYAKNSKGENQVDLPRYGLIYLKMDKDIEKGNLKYKDTAFENPNDGYTITKKAFDLAWDKGKKYQKSS